MIKDFIKFVGYIDNKELQYIVEKNLSLMQYETTANWISSNLKWLRIVYKMSKKENIDTDKLLLDGREHNEGTYKILSSPMGKSWLRARIQEFEDLMR